MHSGMTLEPFLFLCRLAYAARYRIPLIITVVFIALDIQMQVEINVEMRSVHRDADLPSTTDDDNQSEGSWITIEEVEEEERIAISVEV